MPFMPDILPALEIETATPITASVIWLHGLGADGHDFESVVPELRLPKDMGVRFIFPHAPAIPVTINGGYVMPAWYDILEMDIDRKIDETHLLESAQAIARLIDREIERGIPSRRIVLAGFSQGGAVAYQTALTYPQPLAGLLALSTYFATANSIVPHESNKTIPVNIQHGTYDDVVPEALGTRAYTTLTARGYHATYHTYPMQHQLCLEQIQAISVWLQKVLR